METKKGTGSLGEILYWLFFGSLFLAKGIGLYDGQTVFKLVLLWAAGCLLLKIAIEKYTLGEYLRMMAVIGLTGAAYLTSGEKGLLLYGMMMVGLKYVDMKRLMTLAAVLWAAAFALITFTSLFHMEDTVFKVHDKLGLGHIFRWSLGYAHPNVLQVSYLILAMLILYILGDKFRLKHAFWLFFGNCLVFLYSVSYTGFIMFLCLMGGRIYLYLRKRLCILEKLLLLAVFPACALLSLVAPIRMKQTWFNVLNELLSHRLELAWRYLKPEFISLFGIRVADITTETLTMDNAYLFAFITYGIIPFALICLGTMYMVFRYLKEDKYMEVLIMVTIAVGGLTEPFLYNTSFKNLSFLFMGALLFGSKGSGKEFGLFTGWNRRLSLPMEQIGRGVAKLRELLRPKLGKWVGGAVGAVLLCGAVSLLVSYPEGYVVRRSDCADLEKKWNYYDPQNPEYADFQRMDDYEIGEEIEYFSGNIVKLERFRNGAAAAVIGFCGGYLLCTVKIPGRRKRHSQISHRPIAQAFRNGE